MMQQSQFEQKQVLVAMITDHAVGVGRWDSERYDLTVDGAEIKVRDKASGLLVAYSSTKADFASSLEEFAWDYFANERES